MSFSFSLCLSPFSLSACLLPLAFSLSTLSMHVYIYIFIYLSISYSLSSAYSLSLSLSLYFSPSICSIYSYKYLEELGPVGLIQFQISDPVQRLIATLLENLVSISDAHSNLRIRKLNSRYKDNCNSNNSNIGNGNGNGNIDDNNICMRLWTAVVTSESFHKILGSLKAARKVKTCSTYWLK